MVKFGAFISSKAKLLKQDVLPSGVLVSTIFAGVEWRSPPRLWETLVVGGSRDGYQQRYNSREAALAGHENAVFLASAKRR
jgi:hypothetical protein